MAFPHARLGSLKWVSFALGRSQQPLAWGSKSRPSVRLVFLLAVPATDSTQYLPLISGLVRLAKDERLLETMLTEANPEQLFKALQQVELRIRMNGHNAQPVTTSI
jgi:mannitol/fructose-specific phosphotransferase system IIA component (Ntr-type)